MKEVAKTIADAVALCDSMLDALERKQAGMRDRSKRVAYCAVVLAKAMDIPEDEIKKIVQGALLHEIGKLAIPDTILCKPAALTPEERTVIRDYCRFGYKMVCPIPSLAGAADIVHAHRERFDGSGYPRGLTGDAIPLGARVVAIAEAFVMLIDDRPHRWVYAVERAKDQIRHWAGRHFDPSVVEVLERTPSTVWDNLRDDPVTS
jgi:HD-GYP domain-containing protein (c-di-GMP phosphodiesterase class II)